MSLIKKNTDKTKNTTQPNQNHKPNQQTNPTAEGIRLMIAPDVRAKGVDP